MFGLYVISEMRFGCCDEIARRTVPLTTVELRLMFEPLVTSLIKLRCRHAFFECTDVRLKIAKNMVPGKPVSYVRNVEWYRKPTSMLFATLHSENRNNMDTRTCPRKIQPTLGVAEPLEDILRQDEPHS